MLRDASPSHPAEPLAEVIVFPARLRTGKIARTAETIIGSTTKGAAYHWRRTLGDLRRQMDRAGLPPQTIDREVQSFIDAVLAEMTRRTCGQIFKIPEEGEIA